MHRVDGIGIEQHTITPMRANGLLSPDAETVLLRQKAAELPDQITVDDLRPLLALEPPHLAALIADESAAVH